jgi:endonuclease YncB( thermonuclease family)
LLAAAIATGALARPSSDFQGKVTHVTDGDSLWVQPAATAATIEVRLVDIDAPEICQAWGAQARDALKRLVQGKTVTLHAVAKDQYGRTLARVALGTLDVNERLVLDGHAWSARGRGNTGPLMAQERAARAAHRGLHAQDGAQFPSDFRRARGSCHVQPPGAASAAAKRDAPASTSGVASAAFACDGRTRCAQMRSCEEARYFTRMCPGAKMDGNHDGVPCEKTLCSSSGKP